MAESELPTLYAWAGEAPAVTRLVDAFYDRVERDDLLSPFFPGGVGPEHRRHVAAWWSEVLGGPADYTPLGGYPRMLAHHIGLGITADQRRRFVSLLSIAADAAGLPDDPEFRAALVGYAEWDPTGHAQLPARGRRGPGGPGAALGLGRRPALCS